MKHSYKITGMTCAGCAATVTEALSKIVGVKTVEVDLDTALAKIHMTGHVPLHLLAEALPKNYSIHEIADREPNLAPANDGNSKLAQLKPLLLIFVYLFAAAFLMNFETGDLGDFMLDFMGLFFIVFSFFKLLDLRGFPRSFRMYDPLAKVLPAYAWAYPFIEVVLGLLFLMRLQILTALLVTIVILTITTFGVTKTLLDKKSIRCACLGTALKLPMTEATFIENFIMLVMAISMVVIRII